MSGRHGILKNTFIVGALTALSRVLGLVREMLQSRLVGAGVEQSAFTLAFAIPNMVRKLFGEGALTAAFVPIFKSEVDAEGIEKASRLARAVMTTVLAMLVALVALSSGALEAVSFALSSREGADTGRISLTCNLVGTLLPYMVFICGAAFGMGVLNSLGRFKAAGFMPALLNICWISALATLFFFPSLSAAARVKWIARAILAAGAVQMAFMMVAMAKAGVSPRPLFSGWGGEKVRKVWRNIAIGALGAGAVQINYMLDQTLAQMASPWAAGVIGYAERLMDLPLGVIGVAFGTVLLPAFAGLFSKGDMDGARSALSSSLQSLLFAMLPAAAGLFVLAPEITSVIYEGRAFDAVATMRVSRAVAVYATGLGFFGFQKTLVPWFQAQGDLKTPLKVSTIAVVLNAALNIAAVALLPVEWRHAGLAASTVVCAAVSCGLLYAFAVRKNGSLGLGSVAKPILKMIFASAAMAFAVAYAKPFAARIPFGDAAGGVVPLAATILAGAVVYLAVFALLAPHAIRDCLPRRLRR